MNKYTTNNHYWRNLTTRAAIILLSTLIVVWFLPRKSGPQFNYEVGKPWMNSTIIAKFKFPIMKSEEALEAERAQIVADFQPYFVYDATVEEKAVEEFTKDFEEKVTGSLSVFKPHIIRRLHQLYQHGIMDTPDYSKLSSDTTAMIRMIDGKNATTMEIRQLLSTRNAYEQLFLDEDLAENRSLLQRYDLTQYIRPNLRYDKERSELELNELLDGIAPAEGQVENGQKIIDRGEIVDAETARILSSLEEELARRNTGKSESMTTVVGQFIYVLIFIVLFGIYLLLFRKNYFDKPRNLMMLFALIILFPVLVSLMIRHLLLSIYILPFAMVAIFARIFMDSRTAFTAHTTMVLICSAAVKYSDEFIVIQMVAGMAAIYSLSDMSKRSHLFKAAFFVTLCSWVMYYALRLIQEGEWTPSDWSMYMYLAVNGIFLLLAYPLMYLIEKAFGFTSNVTLFELSDTNKDLLRQLSEVAPGTFQHSITVGNLAAEIANKIGANGLLVRTGALYHDIGKMNNPAFFTENQAGINPHDKLTSKESARIIISHVVDGVRMADKYNLPNVIKDFITTHHGAGMAKFFFISYKNNHPDEEINKSDFQYPGPNPFTREQALLMMADTVEAASRSLNEYTEESISGLVNRLIDAQVSEGFFTECPITFRDIYVAKQVLIERLRSIYHTRIKYPEMKSDDMAPDKGKNKRA